MTFASYAQEKKTRDFSTMTREEVLQLSMEEMTDLPIEDLMKLIEIAGVSSIEELYALLNKGVTSASKNEESLFDSPLSTTVLNHEEILASGATSIEEALRLVPGIIVREKTNGNYDVQIRGNQNMPMGNMLLYSENTTTLVMVDGRPVFNYGMGGILWETLPVSLGEIDRIEVVRGPSSALYGPNAVDGVINLITKNPTEKTSSVNFQGGTQNTFIGDMSMSDKISDKLYFGVSTYFEYRERNTDKIYAFADDDNNFDGGFLDLETYEKYNSDYLWSNDVPDDLFVNGDSRRAKQKIGANGYITYNPNGNLKFRLAGGYLGSEANTSTVGDNPTPYNIRQSKGGYTNFDANVYGINIKAALSDVVQDFNRGHKGWTQATEQYNLSADYLIRMGALQIRPGISYQSVYYDDRDYIDSIGSGYFNDRVALRNYAGSVRFDYTLFEKIRLVAALRAEKYNVPDKWIPSWQFVGSYKLNDNFLFRAVYSRANQSTFMINAFSNYTWNRDGLGSPEFVHFAGNKNPDMMTMDMFEFGFRARPTKAVYIDFEAFYNKANGFSALMPDSMVTTTFVGNPALGLVNPPISTTLYTSYQGQDVESQQIGASLAADVVLGSKLLLKAHATYQQTVLDRSMGVSRDAVAQNQIAQYYTTLQTDMYNLVTTGVFPKPTYSSDVQLPITMEKDDVKNESLPSFWGSLALIYRPMSKLEVMTQGYYYSNYVFNTQYGENKMDGKFLLNAKITYKATDNLSLFVNGRNIINTETQEFSYMDNIGGLYLAGLNYKF